VPFTRFVLNQDTGGAIKGPGRADLFWGQGQEAELGAGFMQHEGELYFLVRGNSFLVERDVCTILIEIIFEARVSNADYVLSYLMNPDR